MSFPQPVSAMKHPSPGSDVVLAGSPSNSASERARAIADLTAEHLLREERDVFRSKLHEFSKLSP